MTATGTWTDIAATHLAPRHADGRLVYAVGDVHGCYDELRALLALIAADIADRADGRPPVLVLCGDYVDRGPRSTEVVEAVIWLKDSSGLEVHALAGNHEQALLDFLADPLAGADWLDFGGGATLRSYGVDPAAGGGRREGLVTLRNRLLDAMPAAHLRFLETLEPWLELGDCIFVHAGLRPGVPLADQSREDLLWIREGFLDHANDPMRLVIHGHSWTDAWPQVAAGRLGIDTGAYETGVLTAVRIDGGRIAYARTDPARRKAA